jgi:hypothetical protein
MDMNIEPATGAVDIFTQFETFEDVAKHDAASLEYSAFALSFNDGLDGPNRFSVSSQLARHNALARTVERHRERNREFIVEFGRESERAQANLRSILDAKSRLYNDATLHELLPGELAAQELYEKSALLCERASQLMEVLNAALAYAAVKPAFAARYPGCRNSVDHVSPACHVNVEPWTEAPVRPTFTQELDSLLKASHGRHNHADELKG